MQPPRRTRADARDSDPTCVPHCFTAYCAFFTILCTRVLFWSLDKTIKARTTSSLFAIQYFRITNMHFTSILSPVLLTLSVLAPQAAAYITGVTVPGYSSTGTNRTITFQTSNCEFIIVIHHRISSNTLSRHPELVSYSYFLAARREFIFCSATIITSSLESAITLALSSTIPSVSELISSNLSIL